MGTIRALPALLGALVLAGCGATPTPAPAPPAISVPSTPARTFRPADSGVYANLFLPPGPGRHRALLVVGGSEGGDGASSFVASALAQQGFVTMAVAYFKEPGLPPALTGIPIEYFVQAARLLAAQPEVDPAHVAVMGTSRGSEAAVLAAARVPDVLRGVVLDSPTSLAQADTADHPAWTWQGAGVPTAPLSDWGVPDPADAHAALLPVARTTGPIVTVCGDEDAVWAACPYSAELATLAARPVTALRYPLAGHDPIGLSLLVDSGHPPAATLGGTLADNAAAGRDAITHVVATLRDAP